MGSRSMAPLTTRIVILSLVATASGCLGRIGDGNDDAGGDASQMVALDAPLRRLTKREYQNTIRDLLGIELAYVETFPADQEKFGFDNNVLGQAVTLDHVNKYQNAAEQIAALATENLPALLGCDPAALAPPEQDACVQTFIGERFGPRAYRRPLTDDEAARLLALYQAGKNGGSVEEGVQWAVTAMLESPHFLYRPELGVTQEQDELPLSDFEVASRLSYFLWQSMPDDILFDAAQKGLLRSPDEIEGQARRMLADPRAKPALADFVLQWFELTRMDEVTKDPALFPEFTDALRAAMVEESERFVTHVLWSEQGTLAELLTSTTSFVNGDLASLYGLSGASADWAQVELDPSQRAGLLTQASLMSRFSTDDATSPIPRGLFVRQNLMCQSPPPPPTDLMIEVPPQVPGQSTRERFEQHRADPACAGCHVYFDPIGFGFENYDPIGRYRTVEEYQGQTVPIDASGEVASLSDDQDISGQFVGAVELGGMLGESALVRQCMVTRMFRFTFGRQEISGDRATLDEAYGLLTERGNVILEAIVAMTRTKLFRYRAPLTVEE